MKRLLSLVICIVLISSVLIRLPFTVSAATYSGNCGDSLTWSFDTESGVLTISGEGKMDNFDKIFDDTLEYTLTVPWKEYSKDIKTVTISCGVTSIGDYAFCGCSSLASAEIPGSVTSIGFAAFSNCSSLTSVVIPDGVTSVGDYAFYCCRSLKNLEIPDTLTSIGNQAFSVLFSLEYNKYDNAKYLGNSKNPYVCLMRSKSAMITSCNINSNTKFIYSGAFTDLNSLTSIAIPAGVKLIGTNPFSRCPSLESITVDKENRTYHSDGNCIIETKTKRLIAGCNNSVIPSDGSVTSIETSAFYGCSSLASVEIPDGVTSIGGWAFDGCSSLASIEIPDSVTSIETSAFYGCSSLASVEIPDGVTSIGDNAFFKCDSLMGVSIPDSVTSIGDNAFFKCDSLTYNTYDNAKYLGNSKNPYVCLIKASDSKITSCTINSNTKFILTDAFRDCCSLTSINIPDSVTSIGQLAFSNCSITSIEIPYSVKSIGYSAFESCYSMTSVVISANVTLIDMFTFSGCSSLTSVTIPASVKTIEENSFERSESISDVYFQGTENEWNNITVCGGNASLLNAEIHFLNKKPGDATGDGFVDMKDVLLLRMNIAGVEDIDDANFDNADIFKDGVIDMKDVLSVRLKIAGID